MVKAQLEFQLAGTVKDKKNGFLICVNSERSRDNTDPLFNEVGHLTNWDVYKAERFKAFFAPIYNSNNGSWASAPGELEDDDRRKYKLPVNSELACDLVIQLDVHKCMEPNEAHPRVLKDLADVITRPLSTTFQQPEESTGKCEVAVRW